MNAIETIILLLGICHFVSSSTVGDVTNDAVQTKRVDLSRGLVQYDDPLESFVEIDVYVPSANANAQLIGNALANIFPHSYNTVANGLLDPLHRRVNTATFQSYNYYHRYLQGHRALGRLRCRIKVKGRCKACPVNSRLFNDAIGRLLQRLPTSSPSSHSGIVNKCEVSPDEFWNSERSSDTFNSCVPTILEFLPQYKNDVSNSSVGEYVSILGLDEEKEDSFECRSSDDCPEGSYICAVNRCIDAGNPVFVLVWKGEYSFHLTVKAPDGNISEAHLIHASDENVQEVAFPLSNRQSGTYNINVEYFPMKSLQSTAKSGNQAVISNVKDFPGSEETLFRGTWTLLVNTNSNGLETLVETGSGSQSNIKFNFLDQ